MTDTTYNGAFIGTRMTQTLTPEDIRDLLTGFIAAIELDQIRVDALPPEKFHHWYSDSMWRNWRRYHLDYINRLLPSVNAIPSALLQELAWLAITYEPAVVRATVIDLFADAASGNCPAEEFETAALFSRALTRRRHYRILVMRNEVTWLWQAEFGMKNFKKIYG